MRDRATNGYIRRMMALHFLPHETIAATFDSLKPELSQDGAFTAVRQLHRGKLDSQRSLAFLVLERIYAINQNKQ